MSNTQELYDNFFLNGQENITIYKKSTKKGEFIAIPPGKLFPIYRTHVEGKLFIEHKNNSRQELTPLSEYLSKFVNKENYRKKVRKRPLNDAIEESRKRSKHINGEERVWQR